MDRKMNFFRFCRWSLAALPVFLVFLSCDQLLPPAGSGELVQVRIRAVSIAGGAQNQTVTRASGQKRIVGEPVIQNLGDGMLAEITVEEDLSALRKGDKSLTPNAWFRIIAIETSSGHYLSHADFQAKTSGEYTSANLHVPSGMACDFICFSYNSTTVSLPVVDYTVGAELPTHSMDGSTDFLYQRQTSQTITADNSSLAFDNLWHQLAKVSLVFDTSYNEWPITAVNSNALPTIGSLAIPSGFTLTNTTPPSGSATTQSFTGWPATFGLDQTEAPSGELRVVPVSTSTDFTLTIPAGAVTLSGPSTASQPTAKKTYTITTALEKGKSYIVRMKPYLPKFAGSNIYWDSSKSQLTFDDHDDYTNTKYQGVHFKWGSLIGVSPAQTNDSKDFSSGTAANGDPNDSNVTLDGTPIYMKDPDGNWVKTNVAYATSEDKSNGKERWFGENSVGDNTSGSNGAWSPIPYGSTDGPYGTDKYNLLTNHSDFAGYRGDICNYINPAYRMPTSDELKALYNSNSSTYYSGFSSSSITNQTADGKTALAQFGTFTGISSTTYYLPASGYRANSSGMLYFVGDNGYSWSGSASVSGAYYLRFDSSDASASMSNTDSEFGFSVRCVKN